MPKVIDIDRAVRLNRQNRVRLGWGTHIPAIGRAIGYTGPVSDEKQFSKALATWQEGQGLAVDGVLGPITWGRLRSLLGLPATPVASSVPSEIPSLLGTLVAAAPGRAPVAYRFTPDDLVWTAKLLVHEAGGEEDAENAAVLWAMFNRYALFTRTVFPSFAAFVRAYSTTLQPVLLNSRAAQAHVGTSQFVPTGGVYPGTSIPRGQLRRHLDIQRAPWSSIKPSARRLAVRALLGNLPNPGIGNASDFASTLIFYRRRHKKTPSAEEWRRFTEAYAASKKRRWIGQVPGINQMKNAFFLDLRVANLPAGSVRVTPPTGTPVAPTPSAVPQPSQPPSPTQSDRDAIERSCPTSAEAATSRCLNPGSLKCPAVPNLLCVRAVAGVPFEYVAALRRDSSTNVAAVSRRQGKRVQRFKPEVRDGLARFIGLMRAAGMPIEALLTMGSLVCRCQTRSNKLSDHSFGEAIDIAGVRWSPVGGPSSRHGETLCYSFRNPEQRALLVRINACLRLSFPLVLDYNYNAAHENHFHVDLNHGNGRPQGKSTVRFVQEAVGVLGRPVSKTGLLDSATKAALSAVTGVTSEAFKDRTQLNRAYDQLFRAVSAAR